MKRSQTDSTEEIPSKKAHVAPPSVSIGSVTCLEEMDMKVLKFQNQKLAESVEERRQKEDYLKLQVSEEKEQKKVILDMLAVVNRYWYQLDADVAVMLQSYQPPSVLDNKPDIKEEKDEKSLMETVQKPSAEPTVNEAESTEPTRAQPGLEKPEQSLPDLKTELEDGDTQTCAKSECSDDTKGHESPSSQGACADSEWTLVDSSNETTLSFIKHLSVRTEEQRKEELLKKVSFTKDAVNKLFGFCQLAYTYKKDIVHVLQSTDSEKVEQCLKKQLEDLTAENRKLQDLITSLQDKHHTVSLDFSDIRDKYAAAQQEISELNTRLQDAEYDMTKANHRVDRLVRRLNEVETNCVKLPEEGSSSGSINMTPAQIEELQSELQEHTELSKGRLEELEKLQEDHKNALQDIERLKLELKQVPESVIIQSAPYKSLQTNFSLLYNEATQMRQQSEETKKMLMGSKTQHLVQLEQLEADFLTMKKKFKSELIQTEEALLLVRRDYEMLRMEFEQNLKSNEQTGPLTKEMHHLINSLQNHNHQLKGEIMRYKRKLTEAQEQITKLETESTEKSENKSEDVATEETQKESVEAEQTKPTTEGNDDKEEGIIEDHDQEEGEIDKDTEEPGPSEAEYIKDLKSQLKKAEENVKETKLVLDVYKGATKDMRDKVELLTTEKKLKADIEALKVQVQELREELEQKKGAMADEEAIRKLKVSDEAIEQLQKNLAATKQEEDALLAEMEFTGQAFEEMQEQNVRFLQQLREKDDANLKLMSERIKANQIQKQLREEKDVLADQMTTLNAQRDAQLQVLKKFEEREKALQSTLTSIEKELGLRQQVMDMHKRKALESAQAAQDLKLRLESCQLHLQEVEKALNDKVTYIEEEGFRVKRIQEEAITLRRKVDKHKKMEYYGAADEILMEEIKMYKAKLTCPCCNSRKKDAILTKCFHVFCFECLKTRYDTRQRKCPKCNATFGNNDFHKMYL